MAVKKQKTAFEKQVDNVKDQVWPMWSQQGTVGFESEFLLTGRKMSPKDNGTARGLGTRAKTVFPAV